MTKTENKVKSILEKAAQSVKADTNNSKLMATTFKELADIFGGKSKDTAGGNFVAAARARGVAGKARLEKFGAELNASRERDRIREQEQLLASSGFKLVSRTVDKTRANFKNETQGLYMVVEKDKFWVTKDGKPVIITTPVVKLGEFLKTIKK